MLGVLPLMPVPLATGLYHGMEKIHEPAVQMVGAVKSLCAHVSEYNIILVNYIRVAIYFSMEMMSKNIKYKLPFTHSDEMHI